MSPNRSRFVSACQQLLALAVVLAALTPAASVVTLDVVGTTPSVTQGAHSLPTPGVALADYTAEAVQESRVPTAPVRSHVREVQLTAPTTTSRGYAVPTPSARVATDRGGSSMLTSTPQRVTGFGEVGVTWAHGVQIPETALTVRARTRTDGVWTPWSEVPYDPEHGPDPGSAEARHARPGTDPVLVGKVGQVQVQVESADPLPADMELAVVSPGHARHSAEERAAIDTSTMDGDDGADSVYAAPTSTGAEVRAGDSARLAAAVFTPRPVIYSRKQWGADERIRGKSSLHYGDVHAGFVHHTVNANDYTRAEVPGLLRSIYAYHVKSRGWSDIGYNYLIDRFGRIWEGRYGGVDRAVVGAHTLGYNDDSFAASAIGNYQIAHPSKAMIQAYAALFAWKLSLHGVNAASTHQWVTKSWFEAINGHRDAAATLCPGQYLYAKIPRIRALAAAAQRGWSGRQLDSDLASTPAPDIVVRRASDGEAFVVPTGGLIHFPPAVTVASGATGGNQLVVTRDITGDGHSDLLVRRPDGSLSVRPGKPGGTFGTSVEVLTGFAGLDQVVAPGDLNGDGRRDLAARNPVNGALVVFLQVADGRFHRQRAGTGWGDVDLVASAGDLDGDGNADLVARDSDGTLWRFAGHGDGTFAAGVEVPGRFARYDVIAGAGDMSRDGRPDLLVRSRKTGNSYVLPGNGDGTFSHRLGPVARFAGATDLAVGRVAGSAVPDVVALDGGRVKAWISPGGFTLGRPIDTHADLSRAGRILVVGDWDRDGYGDVVTRQASGNLVLWRGDGHGHLVRSTVLATGFDRVGKLTAVGDMTGDGYPDLVGQPRGTGLRVYPGKGLAGLKASYPVHGRLAGGTLIGVGRWNADGAPDSLLRHGPSLTLLHGNGPGGLHAPSKVDADLSPYDWAIGISDLRVTGHPDLIVRQRKTGRLYALPGAISGLRSPVFLGSGFGGYDLAG